MTGRSSAFGRRLAGVLDARGLNKYDVAERAGVSRSSMISYLNGSRRPSRETAERLRAVLGCSEEELPDPPGARRHVSETPRRVPDHEAFLASFARRLRAVMDERGLSVHGVVARCGICAPMVSRYAAGLREPRASSLAALCQGLGVSADRLLGIETPDALADGLADRLADRLNESVRSVVGGVDSLDEAQCAMLLEALNRNRG